MLSYKHGYHAGNHADVLKHLVLIEVLEYLVLKEKPLYYIDTHSGAGVYNLKSPQARLNSEHLNGALKINPSSHSSLARYCDYFSDEFYCGSVKIAQTILRPQDRLRLFELHSSESRTLEANTKGDQRVKCFNSNGFEGAIAQVPPPSRRALILIDPAYETRDDYFNTVTTVDQALKRFKTGCYLVWYPLLKKPEVERMRKKLGQTSLHHHVEAIDVQLIISKQQEGMYGSGMFIINPPWLLENALQSLLPLLVEQLAPEHGSFKITYHHVATA